MSTPSATTTPRTCCSDSCCPAESKQPPLDTVTTADAVRTHVRAGYAAIAKTGGWSPDQWMNAVAPAASAAQAPTAKASCCCAPAGGCCGPATFSPEQLAKAIGYAQADAAIVPDANLGLSCGNPTAIASLKPGEVVLDLGSGAGFDCFIAGPKVGQSGRVIGVDMTPDMLSRARINLATYARQTGLTNVEFRLGEIEHLPTADASVDVVISNCVLNLSPDKPQVWREIARVLRPGGRVAVSDLALLQPLPDAVAQDIAALIGCVAGAVLVEETRAQMQAAGFTDITLRSKPEYIDAMTNWEDPLYRQIVAKLPAGAKASDYITSLDISARKP
jgi:SAM-dependent methyltransferase